MFQLSNVSTHQIFFSANFLSTGRIDVENANGLEDAYGMNIEYSEFMDWTHEIIKNKDRFARALQLQMSLIVADMIFTSSRSTIMERLDKENLEKISYILGNEDKQGLKNQFKKELEAIKNFFFPVEHIINETLI